MAPVVKNPPANAGDMRRSFAPGEGNGNPLQYSCLDITLFGTNYLINGTIMYFFWSKGTIKIKITGALKFPWTSGPVSDALQFPGTSFVIDHGLDVGAASAQWIFHLLVLKVTQGLSDTASSPGQCLNLARAPLLSVLHARLTLPSSHFQALSHYGNFVLALILIYSQVPS